MEWSFEPAAGSLYISGKGRMDSWTEQEKRPWQDLQKKIRRVVVENGVTSVGDCAFMDCTELRELQLADTVEFLGVYSFRGCTALTSVKLPKGLRVICAKAFRACTSLERIELPVTLTNIDMRAFSKDEALRKVIYEGTFEQWKQIKISMAASDNRYLLEAELECRGTETEETVLKGDFQDKRTEDRYHEMIHLVRLALEGGGDGNLYFMTPSLTVPGIRSKCGDCTLVVFPDGRTMMIDAGYTACSEHIIHLLRDLGMKHLDSFVLSHAHDDHAGGALAVAQYLYGQGGTIDSYYRTSYIESSKAAPALEEYLRQKGSCLFTEVLEGDQWKVGKVGIDVYHPTQELLDRCDGTDTDVNNVSILMKFTYGRSVYLTGGDLYQDREAELAERYGDSLKADVIKSNHHGTYTSNGQKWLQTVNPRVIITDAEDVGNALLADYAADRGIAYYSAGLDGLILVTMAKDSYEVMVEQMFPNQR